MVSLTLLLEIQGKIFILAPRLGTLQSDGTSICVMQTSLGLLTPGLLFLAKHFSNPGVNSRDTKSLSLC